MMIRLVAVWLAWGWSLTFAGQDLGRRFALADSARACKDYARAIALYTDISCLTSDSLILMDCLQARASCHKVLAHYGEALADYKAAILYAGRSQHAGSIELNMSDLLIQTGRFVEAQELLETLCFKGEREVVRLGNLTVALAWQGKYEEALEMLEEVEQRAASEFGTGGVQTAVLRQNRGFIRMSKDEPDYTGAAEDFEEAARWLTDSVSAWIVRSNLALAVAHLGNFERALGEIDYVVDCLGRHPNVGEAHPDYIIALRKKAEIEMMAGNMTAAHKSFETFYQAEKTYLLKNFAEMSVQQRLDLWKKEKPLLSKVFGLEAEAPGLLFDVALLRRQIAMLGEREPEVVAEQLRMDHREVQRRLGEKDVAIEFFRYAIPSVGADGLREEEVYYGAVVCGHSSSPEYIRLFSEKMLHEYKLSNSSTLLDAACSLKSGDKNAIYTDSALARMVWEPFAAYLQDGGTVRFSPEGLLNLVAIEYLPFAWPGKVTLKRQTGVASARKTHSRSDGTFGSKPSKGAQEDAILLLGGMDYNEVPEGEEHAEADHSTADYLKQVFPSFYFTNLVGTKEEIDSLHGLLPAARFETTLSEEAAREEFETCTMLHVSTHAYSLKMQVPEVPELLSDSLTEDRSLSGMALVLSGANLLHEMPLREDGLLSAREICEYNLADLNFVALSACQTAGGEVSDEGAVGMVRALKKAGAGTILATLWPVSDAATSKLMKSFYTHLQHGASYSEALLAAQEELRNFTSFAPSRKFDAKRKAATYDRSAMSKTGIGVQPYKAPYFWAAFILIDD